MAIRSICVALLVSSLPIAGCGTVANLITPTNDGGGMVPFGGVSKDMNRIKKATNQDCGCTHPEQEQPTQVAKILCSAADLPFSFLGDVVTWPYTASYAFINQPTPVPPVIMAPPHTQSPAQETLPAPKPDTEAPSLPSPRPVEPLLPKQGVLLLPTISPADAGRAGPN